MSHEVIYFTLWFLVTIWLIWDVHRAHQVSQQMLRDIARFLGTDQE